MLNPKVSIIVSVFNVEKHFYKCIDSILSQSFVFFECILVDDCSTDNCPSICDEYAKSDARIKVIHNEKNIGLPLSRKKGLSVSQGNYIQFIDGDDWIENEMIDKMYQKANSGNYDITICDYFYEKNDKKIVKKQDIYGYDKIELIKKILSVRIKTVVWNKFIKRELLLLVDFPEYSRSEDYVITIQNICNANEIGYIDIPLYHYRYNINSLSNNSDYRICGYIEENRNWRKILLYLKDKYEILTVFEPELSKRLNFFKEIYVSDKELKSNNELFELFEIYQPSNFTSWMIYSKVKKIVKKLFCL